MPRLEGSIQEFAILAAALEQSIQQLRAGLNLLHDVPALRSTREHMTTLLSDSEALLKRLHEAQ